MALPHILVSRGAHNESQHASVLENAAAVQNNRGRQRERTCTGTFLGLGFPSVGLSLAVRVNGCQGRSHVFLLIWP